MVTVSQEYVEFTEEVFLKLTSKRQRSRASPRAGSYSYKRKSAAGRLAIDPLIVLCDSPM
jgi:hypothetical protein